MSWMLKSEQPPMLWNIFQFNFRLNFILLRFGDLDVTFQHTIIKTCCSTKPFDLCVIWLNESRPLLKHIIIIIIIIIIVIIIIIIIRGQGWCERKRIRGQRRWRRWWASQWTQTRKTTTTTFIINNNKGEHNNNEQRHHQQHQYHQPAGLRGFPDWSY